MHPGHLKKNQMIICLFYFSTFKINTHHKPTNPIPLRLYQIILLLKDVDTDS